jgi:hypothetical protein
MKLLWFPLVKPLIKQEFNETGKNRERRRKREHPNFANPSFKRTRELEKKGRAIIKR